MKKSEILLSAFLAVFVLLAFSSCEKLGTEFSDIMVVQGIGIDRIGDEYRVTVEILNNEQVSGIINESVDKRTLIYTATGRSVYEALFSTAFKSGNEPIFSHNKVIVIGESTAKSGIRDIFDFFERDYNRVSQLVCIAQNADAADIIRSKLPTGDISTELLENVLEKSVTDSTVPRVRIVDVVNGIESETSALVIPVVKMLRNGEYDAYSLSGCAVFDKDCVLQSYLPTKITAGLAYLDDNIKEGEFVCSLDDGRKVSFAVTGGRTKYTVTSSEDGIRFLLNIKCRCDICEIEGGHKNSDRDELIAKLCFAAQEEIKRRCMNTFGALKKLDYPDAVRFGARFRKAYPEKYAVMKNDWERHFSDSALVVKVKVTIRRIGEESFKTDTKP